MSDDQNELLLEEREGRSCFEKPSLPCSLVWLMLCVLAIGMGVGIAIIVMQAADKPPMVLTSCGMVEGYYQVEADVDVYQGVPYAVPPTGDLRWRRPVALTNTSGTCWAGTMKAVKEHQPCPRLGDDGNVIGIEDCLLLDIYAPAGSPGQDQFTGLWPVAVWMDAGPQLGAAAVSPGVALTANTQIVYVNVQYRLGALGFMVAEQLEKNLTGNYGIWDQIEALRWIKNNIKNFGGDPNKITLMSQSSGSTSGLPLVTSPYTRGLFQRAWLMCTSPVLKATPQEAKVNAVKVINDLKCTDAKCLRDLPVKDILTAASKYLSTPFILELPKKDQFQTPMAVVDGDLIPVAPEKAWQTKSGQYPDVPLLIGSIAQMSSSKKQGLQTLKTNDEFLKYIQQFFATFSTNLTRDALDAYKFNSTDSQESKLATLVADIRVGCGLNALFATAASALNSSIFRYVVTNQPSSRSTLDGDVYATQGWDSYAFFEKEGMFLDDPAKQGDLDFARVIQKVGLAFIRTGATGEARWNSQMTSAIDDDVQVLSEDYHKAQCDFWAQAGLLEYGWVN